MKFLLKLLFGLLLALLAGAGAAVWLAFDDAPLLLPAKEVSAADVERAKRLLDRHDPRKQKGNGPRHIALTQADLDALLGQAAKTLGRAATARIVPMAGGAALQLSLRTEGNPLGHWLNVDAQLREAAGLPRFESLRIGRLPVPAWLADVALEQALARVGSGEPGRLATQTVQSVRFTPGQVHVAYEWRAGLASEVRALLVPPADAQRLRVYVERLSAVVAKTAPAQEVSLAALMGPLFSLAAQRSAAGEAARENRAALIVLTFHANGRNLAALTPAAREWPSPAKRSVTLAGREDFAKHLLVSAVLAAESGGALADAVGLFKEVDDSRRGSGFSFNDIAADRAGTRLGELAVQSPQKLQAALAGAPKESDFMPEVRDLPEFMPEAEFKRRFGGVGAPAYDRMMRDIEVRVAALRLFR
jgi:hypothetical protein